ALRNSTARTASSCSSAATASSISRKNSASSALTLGLFKVTTATAPSRTTSTNDIPATSVYCPRRRCTSAGLGIVTAWRTRPARRRLPPALRPAVCPHPTEKAGSARRHRPRPPPLPMFSVFSAPPAPSRPGGSVTARTRRTVPSEHGHHCTLVLLQNELAHLRPRQRLSQLQQRRVRFVAGPHRHHVDVRRLGAFNDDGVLQRHQPRLQSVVGVDDRGVHVGQRPGKQWRLQLPEAEVPRVLRHVKHRGRNARTFGQPDKPGLLQQQKGPTAVG